MSKKNKTIYAKLIANPGSGNVSGRGKLLEEVSRTLKKLGIKVDVAVAKPKERTIPIARKAIKDGYKVIIAMGGDDTIEAVIRGIVGEKVILGMIPVGTANNLAKGLGIPEDTQKACELIASGQYRKLDLGKIKVGGKKKLTFFELVTVGIAAAIYPDALHARKGRLTGIAGAIHKALTHEVNPKVTLEMDDESTVTLETMLAIVSNVPLIGPNMLVDPNASSDDGLFDVSVFANFSKAELLSYTTKVMNMGYTDDGKIQRYRARRITIKSTPKLDVMADGVMMGKGNVKIKLKRGALRVFAPEVGTGVEKPLKPEDAKLPRPVASVVEQAKNNGVSTNGGSSHEEVSAYTQDDR